MEQKNKPIEQMDFQELWDYLREQSRNKFLYVCKVNMMQALEMSDATLRDRKRNMKFSRLERRELVKILKDYTGNDNLKEDILFPNNPEKFANDYYRKKNQKQTV